MEIEIASPNEEEKMRMKQYQAQIANIPKPEKGMGGQMMDMAKQKAMEGALNKGQSAITSGVKPYMQGITNAINPMGSAGAGAVAGQAATNAALASTPATMGMAGAELGALASGAGGAAGMGGMAALGTAVPYIGAGLLAGKALGLFNEGGKVGPLSLQYKAEGGDTMSQEEAMALMNNQPKINFPDPEELLLEMSMPTPRPTADEMYLYNNPSDASMISEGYEIIAPPYIEEVPQYKVQGGPLTQNSLLGMTKPDYGDTI